MVRIMSNKSYIIHTIEDDGDFYFILFEKATEQVIDFFYFQEDAINYADFLENGGAFNGFTPTFMLQTITQPTDINQKFSNLLTE